MPKLKEVELKKLQSQLEPLEKECTQLEENYTKVNSSGFEKSKKLREEKDVLAPEELKLQKIVGSKQNQVSYGFEVALEVYIKDTCFLFEKFNIRISTKN